MLRVIYTKMNLNLQTKLLNEINWKQCSGFIKLFFHQKSITLSPTGIVDDWIFLTRKSPPVLIIRIISYITIHPTYPSSMHLCTVWELEYKALGRAILLNQLSFHLELGYSFMKSERE